MLLFNCIFATLLLAVVVRSQVDPLDPCAYDCQPEDDGFFANGCCESSYCQCYGGHEFLLHCPDGEIFNPDVESCDFEWHVPCCNSNDTTTREPETTTETVEYCENNDCLENGYFAEGACVPDFCHCVGGTGFLLHCQDGLFYNEVTHACDWPWNNPSCLANSTTTQPPSSECNYTCTEENGEFAEGCCEESFCVCFHGEGSLHYCPPGAVFNEEEGYCDEPETVPCCNSSSTATPSNSTTGSPQCTTVDCTNLMDGPYAEGCCLEDYCVCEEGIGFPHTCVNGTFLTTLLVFVTNLKMLPVVLNKKSITTNRNIN